MRKAPDLSIRARPLVSVVTGTRSRPAEIENAIYQVRAQTYRPLEHVIVSDGPDPVVAGIVKRFAAEKPRIAPELKVPIIFQETGRCWSDEMASSPGAAAFQVAQLLAHGEYQMWFSDDEEMEPDHIEALMDLMEEEQTDFAYSMAVWYTAKKSKLPPISRVIGVAPPEPDHITNCIYRTALLDYGKFETHVGRGTDWHQISKWLEAGASYSFLERVTFRHRADQIGGHCSNTERQPLRGWRVLV